VNASILKCVALALAVVAGASGCGSGGAVDLGSASDHIPAAKYLPKSFPVLPPVGAKPSTPSTGKWVIDVTYPNGEWSVYPDGRMIYQAYNRSDEGIIIPQGADAPYTGYVQQRLTRRGVDLLRSRILATGLFRHDLGLASPRSGQHRGYYDYRFRTRSRIAEVDTSPHNRTAATPAQARALAQINALLTDPTRHLPPWAWADRTIRPWVPTYYIISHDRYAPDPSRLPAPANAALAQYTKFLRHYGQRITTTQARALLQAFQKAGIAPAINNAGEVFYDFAGLHMLPGGLSLWRAFPNDISTP
jgi:hypothetical protein